MAGAGAASIVFGKLSYSYGILIDSSNTLYVTDYNNNRVQKFLAGTTIGTTVAGQPNGISGSNATTLNHPSSILLDSNGNLYVSDTYNHRVQFILNGSFLETTIACTGKKMSTVKFNAIKTFYCVSSIDFHCEFIFRFQWFFDR